MAIFTLKDVTLYIAQYDLTSDFHSCQFQIRRPALDKTTWGQTSRIHKGGLYELAFSGEGFYQADSADPQVDDALSGQLGTDGSPVTVTPVGAADGNLAWLFESLVSEYQPFGNSVGDLTGFAVGTVGAGKWARGIIGLPKATYSVTTAGTGYQLGAVAAGQRMHAALHVFSGSAGDTLNVTIKSAALSDFVGATTELDFTNVVGDSPTSEFLFTDGSAITNTWWRVEASISGDGGEAFVCAVSLGIR